VALYIVTIKLPRGHAGPHDPRNKQSGSCAVSAYCTDVTGEHHSLIVEADTTADAAGMARGAGYAHVTRVERATKPLGGGR